MAKKTKDENDSKEVVLVKVKALKNINTSLHGNIKEGKEGELPSDLAEQLFMNGDCEIVE